jgi:L-iditol 2-dehydrogenase
MKSLVLVENKKFQIHDRKLPILSKSLYRVRIRKSGICSSDIYRSHEKGAYHYPLVMGHELVGEIIEAGEDVNGYRVGSRVAVFPLLPCFKCEACKKEVYAQCYNYDYYGSRIDGGFAEVLDVYPWNLMLIPDDVRFEDAVSTEPMAVVVHALKKLDLLKESKSNSKNIVILGGGFLGLLMVQILNKVTNLKITIVDRNKFKLKAASKFTCKCVHLSNEKEWETFNKANSFDYVIEATGNPKAFSYSIDLVNNGGKVLWMGNISGDLTMKQKTVSNVLRKEISIIGIWNSIYIPAKIDDWKDTIKLMQNGIHPSNLVTKEVSLDEVPEMLQRMHNHKIRKHHFEFIKIIVNI